MNAPDCLCHKRPGGGTEGRGCKRWKERSEVGLLQTPSSTGQYPIPVSLDILGDYVYLPLSAA